MSQQSRTSEPVTRASANLVAEQVALLQSLFPEVVTERKIDFEKLRTTLGEEVDDRPERYSFTWAGKRDAIRLLQTPSRATLIPVPEESINFDETSNIFIEGENLEVLKLLYKSYFGRVKMIYIDPPYNTGNDFIYPDNYADPLDTYLRLTGQQDSTGTLLTSNPETSGRYHSAWLSMMYPRLFIASQLLRDDGVIFVSIDDHEVYNLRVLLNEIFGEDNFVTTVIWQKVYSPKNTARHFSEDHDYILVYARNAAYWIPRGLPRTAAMDARYSNPDNDPRGDWKPGGLDARNYYSLGTYPITCPSGRVIPGPPQGSYWRVSPKKFTGLDADRRIWWGKDGNSTPSIKRFRSEVRDRVPQTLWTYKEVGHTQEAKRELLELVKFDHAENVLDSLKPTRLIQRMLELATEPSEGDIILDFFSGSNTTTHAIFKQNRKDGGDRHIISVQLPEPLPSPGGVLNTIADIGKQCAQEAARGFQTQAEDGLGLGDGETPQDLGFRVFKLAESNYRSWTGVLEKDPDAYAVQMEAFADPLVDGWRPEDVIWEVAVKEGYGLSSRIHSLESITSNAVWLVTDPDKDQSFCICLDDELQPATLKALALTQANLFICRDAALTDGAAANLALQCRLKTI